MRRAQEGIPFYIVDAFTSTPFKGNPAAVCVLKGQHEDSFLQLIAAEFNLSETAFLLVPPNKASDDSRLFSLRWFTPTTEVPLCGHATLATAAVLFDGFHVQATHLIFDTKSGKLMAQRVDDSIRLNFPSADTVPVKPSRTLLRTMNIGDFDEARLSATMKMLLVRLKNEKTLQHLEPDYERMKSRPTKEHIEGVIATTRGHPPYDFVSRVFVPWVGINEDPVTGAAHTILAPYWSRILGKKEMLAYQASSRGGELRVRVYENGRVDLIGETVIVGKGQLYLNASPPKRAGKLSPNPVPVERGSQDACAEKS